MRRVASVFLCLVLASTAATAQSVEIFGAMDGSTGVHLGKKRRHANELVFTLAPRASPEHLRREIVPFHRPLPPGSIVVQTKKRKLYYVLPGGEAIEYPVGVGKQGFTWSGTNRITRKAEWPTWRPPAAMIRREAAKGRVLPDYMEGGVDNPLGARALYIGHTEYRIHGTTQPWSIGRAVSSGCIRMLNEHVIDLYDRVEVGARVLVE